MTAISKSYTKIILGASLFFACLFMLTGQSHAISGASRYYPDTSPAGQANSYTLVQVTGVNVTNSAGNKNANTKMKARTTVANVYVPKTLENTIVSLNIVRGCHDIYRDHDVGGGSTDFSINNIGVDPAANLANTDTSNPDCASGDDISVSFRAKPIDPAATNYFFARTYSNGIEYNIYQFIADGNMSETSAATSKLRYLNAFGLSAVTAGVLVGISDAPAICADSVYKMSCPRDRSYTDALGRTAVHSWVYSTFYGPSPAWALPNYNQEINIDVSCDVVGRISIYDLDASDGSLSQAGLTIAMSKRNTSTGVYEKIGVRMLNGATMYELPLAGIKGWGPGIPTLFNAHPGFGGNNDEYMDLPGGDPTFNSLGNLTAGGVYRLTIEGIDSDNAVQVLPAIDHCPAPIVDTAPTVSISQNCSPPYTATITVGDVDYATNAGSPVINYSLNGVAQAAVRARSTVVTMPDPTAALTIKASSTGVRPVPPGGDGLAAASVPATANLDPCTYTFNLEPQPQPPALNDPEAPTSAKVTSLVGFSGGASKVNGVTATREYFINRGGTYNAAAGTLVGGSRPFAALAATTNTLFNVTGKPTDNTLGTVTISSFPAAIQAADRVCVRLRLSPSSGQVVASGAVVAGAASFAERIQCETVVNRPYMRIFGGEVLAGSGFGSTCTSVNSGVLGFAKQLSSPAVWVGAGAQLGVFANGNITSFASSIFVDQLNPSLTAFANSGATGSLFGGGFGAKFCNTDYWSTKQTSISAGNGAIPALNSLNKGQYQYNGGTSIVSSPTDLSKKIAIYVDGDVTITTNIKLSTAAVTKVEDLPSFYLVARGNIYIAPNVTQLDGVYVAMPRVPAVNLGTPADGGRIFTCTDNASAPTTAALSGACITNRLTINGMFAATHVNFLRGGGSLRSALANEHTGSANIAETFNFIPEVLLAVPAPSVITTGQYDSVISLPPAL